MDTVSGDTAVDVATTEEEPAAARTPATSPDESAWPRRISLGALIAAIVPLVVAAVRATSAGWVPVGDVAISVIRTRDVLGGGELPLLGMWSSQSWAGDVDFNHPGPLFYDLLAVPAWLFPGGAGLVVGAIAVSILSIVGLYVVGRRLGGPLVALSTTVVAASLAWSMGSDALVEPWHPNTLLLPLLLFLVLVWAVATGDLVCLPWAVAVGSLLLESNLAFVILVPALLAVVGVKAFVDGRDGLRRVGPVTVAVLVVLWAQPVFEQLFGPGQGNLSRIRQGAGNSYWTLNWRDSIRSVAKVVALPPWGAGNGSFANSFRFGAFGNPLPSLVVSMLALAAGAAVVVICWVLARRQDDHVAAWGLLLAAVVVGLAIVNANLTPSSEAGAVTYRMKWLWPVASFAALAVVAFDARRFATSSRRATWYAGALGVSTLVVAALTLVPAHRGAYDPPETLPVARAVLHDLAAHDLEGPVLVDCREGILGNYCEAVMYQLQRQGTPFVVAEGVGVRQLGEKRRWTGDNATAVVRVVEGDFAVLPDPDARQLALHPGLDEDERLDLFYLVGTIKHAVERGEVTLNDRGVRVARRGTFPSVEVHGSTVDVDEDLVFATREGLFGTYTRDLVAMVGEDLLDAHGKLADRLERYADLQSRWDHETVGVFLLDVEDAGQPPDATGAPDPRS